MRMRASLVVCFLLSTVALRGADVELGIRHLAHAPLGNRAFDGGELEIVASRGFAVTAEFFFEPRLSTQLAATFVNPETILYPSSGTPADVDLNTFGMDTYSLVARYHFVRASRFVPFAGAGVAYTSFGNLEERFADNIEMEFDPEVSPVVEAGLRYHFRGGLWLDATLGYMPLEARRSFVQNATDLPLPEVVRVDPVTLSVGASWRF